MHYYHHVPGRLRIRTPHLKGAEAKVAAVREILERCDGVRSIVPNTVTGSILVEYDRKLTDSDAILRIISHRGYFDLAQARNSEQVLNTKLTRVGETIGKAILTSMLERTFEGSALSLLTALI